jgi:hypothetical protein
MFAEEKRGGKALVWATWWPVALLTKLRKSEGKGELGEER